VAMDPTKGFSPQLHPKFRKLPKWVPKGQSNSNHQPLTKYQGGKELKELTHVIDSFFPHLGKGEGGLQEGDPSY
jgi:hypothetical protein